MTNNIALLQEARREAEYYLASSKSANHLISISLCYLSLARINFALKDKIIANNYFILVQRTIETLLKV